MQNPMSRLVRSIAGAGKTSDLIARADALRDAHDWDGAVQAYRDVLDVTDTLPHIWVQYGHAFKESGRHKEAEEAYRRALALRDEADTHLQLGHLHKIMGRKREAETDYLDALAREPENEDARQELTRLGWTSRRLRNHLNRGGDTQGQEKPETQAPADTVTFIAFDLSDLVDHLHRSRYPTGIQRVQLELAGAIVESAASSRVQFVYYDHHQNLFFEIRPRVLQDFVDLIERADRSDAERNALAVRLKASLMEEREFDFPQGAVLVNTGTSWGFINYFLAIRDLQRRVQLRYVPLVHDCIPLIFPEYCNPNLVSDFINWVTKIGSHADLILTNSQNTKADFLKVAAQMQDVLPPVETIRLNGVYGARDKDIDPDAERGADEILRANNLDTGDFVLFVSTIEPRKNHMLALNAWSRMLKKRPHGQVPRLVCVGSSGWMNDAFTQRLERDRVLGEKVVVLCNVSETLLQMLYRKCAFTLFPSMYEGWGLPISEALAHGKVPLVSRVSSHPEAGGDLAVYFDLDSEADFQAKLEKLIDDEDARHRLEEKIKDAKPLRPWSEIAAEIFGIVDQLPAAPASAPKHGAGAPAIASGRYYTMARNTASSIEDIVHSGEVYRDGTGWQSPEAWGSWSRGRTGDLAFNLSGEAGDDFVVYLFWRGSHFIDNSFTLSLPGTDWSRQAVMAPRRRRLEQIPVQFRPGSKRDVRIRITAQNVDDFTNPTEGDDRRVIAFGVEGLYVCRADDAMQRIAIVNAIANHDMSSLGRRFSQAAIL